MRRLWACFIALLLVAAACGDAGSDNTGAAPTDGNGSVNTTTTAEGPVVPGGTLRYANSVDVLTFDPHQGQDGPHLAYLDPVYEPLVYQEADSEFAPRLATDWEFIDDTTLEISLREGVVFHDGTPFDSSAVKANLERVKGIGGRNSGNFQDIESVEVIDDHTVRIHTVEPKADLLYTLSTVGAYMISPAAMDDPELDRNPVGTGPFRLDTDATRFAELYVFQAFEDYWDDQAPGVETIEVHILSDDDARLNALRTEQVDITTIREAQADTVKSDGFEVVLGEGLWYSLAIFDRGGQLVPELAIPEVRQAMSYAVDRQAIIDAVRFGYGTPAAQPYSEGSLAYVDGLDDAFEYDPDRARDLLAEAGIPDGFTFPAIVLPAQSSLAEAIQGFLADVGINMEIVVIEPGQLGTEARSGNHPAAVFSWLERDPAFGFSLLFANDAAYNPLHVPDDEIQQLGDQAAMTLDDDERAALYAQIMERVVNEAAMVFLHRTGGMQAHNSDIEGYRLLPTKTVPELREITVSS